MDAKTFLTEFNRMCDSYNSCDDCIVAPSNNGTGAGCWNYSISHPQTAVSVIEKWILEHPKKTRLMDLLEKYPDTQTDDEGSPYFYPAFLGYCGKDTDCGKCEHFTVKSTRQCWNIPVE